MAGERTLPGISLTGFWNAGDNTWKAGMDENLRKLSVLVQLRVISRTTWPPDTNSSNSPGVANGDIYIVPAGDSNSAQTSNSDDDFGDIAVHDNGSWVYYTPLNGFLAYVIDEGAYYRYNGSAWVQFGGDATAIAYNSGDTGDSNSTQTNVAAALDDLYQRVRNVAGGVVAASTVSYNSTTDSNSAPVNVQEALDDVYSTLNVIEDQVGGITFQSITAGLTLTAADNKKFYLAGEDSNSPAFIDIGVPEDALEDLPDGFTVSVCQRANSQVRFVAIEDSNSPAAAVLIYPADMQPQTRGLNSVITLLKTNVANEWLVFGDLEPV